MYQKFFFSFFVKKLSNAHLQYVCNIPESIKRIYKRFQEELISQSMNYQPLINMCICRELARLKNAVNLSKQIYSSLNSCMHILNVCYAPANYKRIRTRLEDKLISQSRHHQPLIYMCSGRELAKLKML